MKTNLLLSVCMALFSCVSFGQWKHTYNHYDTSSGGGFNKLTITNSTGGLDLVKASTIGSNVLSISTSNFNSLGELTDEYQFNFNLPFSFSGGVAVNGMYNVGSDRILSLQLLGLSSFQIVLLKYNAQTGVQTQMYVNPDTFKLGFVNSLNVGGEIVNYVVKSTGGFYRLANSDQNFSTLTEEVVDASFTTFISGGSSSYVLCKDAGKVKVFNGKEVIALNRATKSLIERLAANSYSVHNMNSNSSGFVNLVELPNGHLLYVNSNEMFDLDNAFTINQTISLGYGTGINQSEIGVLNNNIYLLAKKIGNINFCLKFDLNLNQVDSTGYNNVDLVELSNFNGKPLLLADSREYFPTEYDLNGNSSGSHFPVLLESFTTTPSKTLLPEFRTAFQLEDLTAEVSLGNILSTQNLASRYGISYHDSVGLLYHMSNEYVGITATDTLGKSDNVYQHTFLPGPYTNQAAYNNLIASKYDKGYYVSKAMIETHIDSLQIGSSNYVAPYGIRNWPAHGDVSIGQAANLAPFVDVNNNSIYEPYLGDYPKIYGDECVFSITHDNPAIPNNAGIETQSFVYRINCDTSATFSNTLFQKNIFLSRTTDFEDFKVGTIADFDLGNYIDDYVGTHTELGLVYTYNGDANDEPNSGNAGFGASLPSAGVLVLKGSKKVNDGIDNPDGITQGGSVNGVGFGDGIVDNEYYGLEFSTLFNGIAAPGQTDPTSITGYANYLSGLYGDGTQPVINNIPTKYVYPFTSDSVFYGTGGADPGMIISEFQPNGVGSISNSPGDRRLIATTGMQKLYMTDTLVYDLAFVYNMDTNPISFIYEPVQLLVDKCIDIKSSFNTNTGACGTDFGSIEEDLTVTENELSTLRLYPNPTSNSFQIGGLEQEVSKIEIYDINGRLLETETENVSGKTYSLAAYDGSMFLVKITSNGKQTVKRIVKN